MCQGVRVFGCRMLQVKFVVKNSVQTERVELQERDMIVYVCFAIFVSMRVDSGDRTVKFFYV